MRTITIHSERYIAVMTQHSIPWRISLFFQPRIKRCSMFLDLLSMFRSSTVDVIYGEKLRDGFPTTLTGITICHENRGSDCLSFSLSSNKNFHSMNGMAFTDIAVMFFPFNWVAEVFSHICSTARSAYSTFLKFLCRSTFGTATNHAHIIA